MKFLIDLAKWLIPIWIVVLVLTIFANVEYKAFIEPAFLFTFLGVFTGFALTLFVHIVTMMQGVKEFIADKTSFDKFYTELKHGIMVLIYGIVLFIAIVIVAPFFDKSFIQLGKTISVRVLFDSLSMAIFVLTIFSLSDLIRISFKVSKDYLDHKK